ncbi:hypothetical protein [Flavobacterium sasangense]|uniref:hypothetical protein n=1 Tax=Flavobacterium sasangense TaxID=503361 RepID=UPI00047DFAD4|nr:hypothetical protein [Flavobacterium sasangense]
MKKIFIICTFFCFFQVISQEKFEIKKIGFSMNSPQGWHVIKDEEALKNLEQYDLTDEQLDLLLKTNTKQLITYSKYDPKRVVGIIPTIKVRTMETKSNSIESFIKEVQSSTEDALKIFEDFRFTQQPIPINVSGKKAVKFDVQFTMKNNGKEYKIVSHSYYILLKGYFISLNFIEEVGKEENSKLFDEIFQSIQISK